MSQILFEHTGIPFTKSSENDSIPKGRMWTEKKKSNSAYLTKLYYNLFNFGFFSASPSDARDKKCVTLVSFTFTADHGNELAR